MTCHTHLSLCVILSAVSLASSWDVLVDMGVRRAETTTKPYFFKNEYVFGDCKNPKNTKKLLHHLNKTWAYMKIVAIYRVVLHYVKKRPDCIILRASSYESDTYRVTKYNFEICISRVAFCYSRERYLIYYMEWFIPEDIAFGLNWDIYLYGSGKEDWLK